MRGLPKSFPLDLAGITIGLTVVALIIGGYRAFYFQGGLLETFSYYSDERTFNEIVNAWIGRDPQVTLVGIHAFGDYLLPNVWTSFDDPWVEVGQVNYLPPSLLIYKILGYLPYTTGLSIYLAALVICTIAPMLLASRGYSVGQRILLISTLALFTGPALASFDRGNIQGLLPVVLFAFAVSVMKQRWGWATTMLVVASLIKIYPIALVLLLLALRQYRWALVAIAASVGGVLLTLPLLATGGLSSLWAAAMDVLQWPDRSVEDFLQYNVSLAGGAANAAYFVDLPQVGLWISNNPLPIIVVYAVVVIPLLWLKSIDLWMRVIVALSLTTSLMPIVYAYALNWVLASTAFAVWIARQSSEKQLQSRWTVRGLLGVLAVGSAVLPIFIPGTMESGRPAGVVTFAALAVYLLLPVVAYASRYKASPNAQQSLAVPGSGTT